MKHLITFLGTGQGPMVIGKQIRASGGIVVNTYDHQIHIDPGPSSLAMAKKYYINPRATSVILVSHSHLNHCNDVNTVIDAMTFGGLDKKGILISNNSLVNGSENKPPYLTKFHKNCLERFIVLKPNQKAAVDNVEIHTTFAKHSVECMGFKLVTPEYAISYLSDTTYSAEIGKQHLGSDILILNVVNPDNSKSKYNLNTEDAIRIISEVQPRLSVITHFSEQMLNQDPLMQARSINRATKRQVVAAKDGLTLNPRTYSSKKRQQKLRYY